MQGAVKLDNPPEVHTQAPKILITGGTGFIGGAVASHLRSIFDDSAIFAPPHHGDGGLDLLDPAATRCIVRQNAWTHIVHACGSHGRRPEAELVALHVDTTRNILDALASHPVWINIGSAAQYGLQDPSLEPTLTEDHPDAPISPYGSSKVQQENIIRAAADGGIVTPIFLRVFNAIGPAQTGPFVLPHLIGELISARASGAAQIPLNRWDAVRDYIDVRDVARAVVAVMQCPLAAGQRFNVCSGNGTRLIDLAEKLASISKINIAWDRRSGVHDTGEIPWQCGSPSKIFGLCGWRPSFSLERTLADAWAAAARAVCRPL